LISGALQLSVTDPDTPDDQLVFTLVKEPRQGSVVQANMGSRTVRVGDTFTYDDVRLTFSFYQACFSCTEVCDFGSGFR